MRSIRALCILTSSLALASCLNLPTTDTSMPQVHIDAPAAGAIVSGSVSILVTATDDFGLDRVTILIDGVVLKLMVTPPYAAAWNSQAAENSSSHIIRAEARDLSGNTSSHSISVTVDNSHTAPPAVPR